MTKTGSPDTIVAIERVKSGELGKSVRYVTDRPTQAKPPKNENARSMKVAERRREVAKKPAVSRQLPRRNGPAKKALPPPPSVPEPHDYFGQLAPSTPDD